MEERIGAYALAEKLGAGGMGEVWKARDVELNRWVALKFLRGSDADEIARFKREAQTAAKLNHPNVAAVYAVGEHAGRHYIAMQYVDGQTLCTHPRDDARALAELMRDAARAVDAAHRRGIVHRDLKPANLMVEAGRVYVMDFGLAKQVSGGASLTTSGMLVGTPAYMSPEQAMGKIHAVDARSDVYSLGATLYELLADRPPFRDENVVELLLKVTADEPQPLPPKVDRDLGTIVMKCLEKEPPRRYGSAGELADDLDRWLKGEAIVARPASTYYRLRKRLAKRKAVVAAALLVPVAAAGVWLGMLPRLRGAEAREEATRFYAQAERDLHVLRLRSYRGDWRLTESELAEYERLIVRCEAQMKRTGEAAQGWWIIGRARQVLGRWGEARAAYARGGDHAACLVDLARLLIEQAVQRLNRRRERATASDPIEEAMKLLARVPGGGGMEHDLARGYLILLQRKPAADYCDEMLRKWAGRDFREEFLVLRGIGTDRMIEDLDAATRARPGYYEAHFLRGLAREARGILDRAVEDYSTAIELNPRYGVALNQRGTVQLRLGRTAEAGADFERAIASDPEFVDPYCNRAGMRRAAGDFEGALADCERAIGIDPRRPESYASRGTVRDDRGDRAGALEDYERALALDPDNAYALCSRALMRADEDPAAAVGDCTRAIEADPSLVRAYTARGEIRQKLGRLAEALADCEQAIAAGPRDRRAHWLRGVLRAQTGDPRGSVDDITKAIEIGPEAAWLYFDRAVSREMAGDGPGARADYDRAIELDPRHERAHVNRGAMRVKAGDWTGAMADYTRAIELDPRDALAHFNRGTLRAGMKDREGAAVDLRNALKLAPAGWAFRAHAEGLLRELE